MADENENGQEKTEEPTPKRRKDAQEKGQVARSRELSTAMAMIMGAAALATFSAFMGEGMESLFNYQFTLTRDELFDPQLAVDRLKEAVGLGLWITMPFGIVLFLVGLISPALLGGWTFSVNGLAPKLDKMNPLKGFKRIFGPQGLMELVKALLKVGLVGGVGSLTFYLLMDEFYQLGFEPLRPAIAHGMSLLFIIFAVLAVSLLLVVAVDVPYQLWDHTKKLRMTRQELKDEFKDTEGKPEVKGRIRQLQREIAEGRMMEAVPDADVVVTNPTHFAVALKYDQARPGAPKVVAKGVGLIALQIREIATENKVALFEAPPLARALYHTTEIGDEIPSGLYLAVAQVLAYIYQLRQARRAGQKRPKRPQPEVPEEFKQYTERGL